MRRILIGAALASLAFSPAYAQAVTQMGGNTCLKTVMVDRTDVKDASTIIYYMKSGEVMKNTLKTPCTTLPHNGYIYMPTPPDNICGNLQRIKVIQTGEVCQLGDFTPYTPPKEGQ
ncbi:MAG TPA: hypothetical protein VLW75_02600 [Rhizomicrobium sp.]|nr:hypothetical protein [Rhizomicrobium sp.]